MSNDTDNKYDAKTFRSGNTIFEWDMERMDSKEHVVIRNETGMVHVPFDDLGKFIKQPYKSLLHERIEATNLPDTLVIFSRGFF